MWPWLLTSFSDVYTKQPYLWQALCLTTIPVKLTLKQQVERRSLPIAPLLLLTYAKWRGWYCGSYISPEAVHGRQYYGRHYPWAFFWEWDYACGTDSMALYDWFAGDNKLRVRLVRGDSPLCASTPLSHWIGWQLLSPWQPDLNWWCSVLRWRGKWKVGGARSPKVKITVY